MLGLKHKVMMMTAKKSMDINSSIRTNSVNEYLGNDIKVYNRQRQTFVHFIPLSEKRLQIFLLDLQEIQFRKSKDKPCAVLMLTRSTKGRHLSHAL